MTYTLIADGGSDAVLLPILSWLLRQAGVAEIVPQRVDFGRIPGRLLGGQNRIPFLLTLYPCDLLFYHRDAEGATPELRHQEIERAIGTTAIRHVPVVPVRMTEAWLLADERAIRRAAGNPNGTEPLELPSIKNLERLPDPKAVLYAALEQASGLGSRRLRQFRPAQCAHAIAGSIDSFSALERLSAFSALQRDVRAVVNSLNR